MKSSAQRMLLVYLKGLIYVGLAATCLFWSEISSALALALGLFMGIVLSNPFIKSTKSLTRKLLAVSVVGLGAGMDLSVVARVGSDGIVYTLGGICVALAIGLYCGRKLGVSSDTSILITVGTAICGAVQSPP